MALRFAAPLLHLDAEFGELRADFVGIGFFTVALVDGDDEGNLSRLRVTDRLLGLRHDRVIGGDNDDGEVSDLSTPRTHGRKGLVTRCIDEGHTGTVFELYAVRTDVLGDAARLTVDDVGLADVVKQGGLTVVNVAHHGHDGWTCEEVLFAVLFDLNGLLDFR